MWISEFVGCIVNSQIEVVLGDGWIILRNDKHLHCWITHSYDFFIHNICLYKTFRRLNLRTIYDILFNSQVTSQRADERIDFRVTSFPYGGKSNLKTDELQIYQRAWRCGKETGIQPHCFFFFFFFLKGIRNDGFCGSVPEAVKFRQHCLPKVQELTNKLHIFSQSITYITRRFKSMILTETI